MCEIGINCVYWWYVYYGYCVFKTFPLTIYFMYDWKTYITFSCIFSKREAVTKLRSERSSPHNDHSVLPEPWKTAFLSVSLGHQTPDALRVQERSSVTSSTAKTHLTFTTAFKPNHSSFYRWRVLFTCVFVSRSSQHKVFCASAFSIQDELC